MKFCSLTLNMDPTGPWISLGFPRRTLLLPSLSVSPLLLLFSPWPCCQTGSSESSPIANMDFPLCRGFSGWMLTVTGCKEGKLLNFTTDTSMHFQQLSIRFRRPAAASPLVVCVTTASQYCERRQNLCAVSVSVYESAPSQICNIQFQFLLLRTVCSHIEDLA